MVWPWGLILRLCNPQEVHGWLARYWVNNDVSRAREGAAKVALMGQLQRALHALLFKNPTPYVSSMATLCAEHAIDAADAGTTFNLRACAKVMS